MNKTAKLAKLPKGKTDLKLSIENKELKRKGHHSESV
jgi:hypothetical protein